MNRPPKSDIFKMHAVLFDGEIKIVKDYPVPDIPDGWAKIGVSTSGICGTDLEITRGYKDFTGILGHEFVGTVLKSTDDHLIGKRVVGEINVGCLKCEWCKGGIERHCPQRKVLGILGLDGCMAEYCILPEKNLICLPESIPEDKAIFMEPLAAACEILEQLSSGGTGIDTMDRVAVLGDGRLGILCAWAIATVYSDITLIGRHPKKLSTGKWRHIKTCLTAEAYSGKADVVVDATGRQDGLETAIMLCRQRGKVIMKTTMSKNISVNLTPAVINELTLMGSRCGRFSQALEMLEQYPDMPLESLITAVYPLNKGKEAFRHAAHPDSLKVLIRS